jgi:hypothetical protein
MVMGIPQRCSFVLILVTVAIIVQSSIFLVNDFGCKGKDNTRNMQGIGWGWSKPNLQRPHSQSVPVLCLVAVLQLYANHFAQRFKVPTLPTLTLSISGIRARCPTLEVALTPTLEDLSTNFWEQLLIFQFSRELVSYSLSNFR